MWVTDSSRAKRPLSAAWLVFSLSCATLMYLLPGEETIPYHLIWASFALLYGFYRWSKAVTWGTFWSITAVTGVAIVLHAQAGIIGWEETSEIVLMGILVALLIMHVNRFQLMQDNLNELRDSERAKAEAREVTARCGSHEVRTRLTIARGFAELIRDNTRDETVRSDAGVVLAELDRASAMTSSLLTLVGTDSIADRVPVDVPEFVSRILKRWSATADRAWSGRSDVGRMLCDAARLESALDCLLENAVKFTGPGDRIEIDVRRVADQVVIAVTDSGCGIPEDEISRVTEVFQTGASAGSRAGSGLGLAIVRKVVESRGGRLAVTSPEGGGTCVQMWLRSSHPDSRPLAPVAPWLSVLDNPAPATTAATARTATTTTAPPAGVTSSR